MPVIKEKVGLVCHSIEFTRFSIVYNVYPMRDIPDNNYPVYSHLSIVDKDLILKPTVFNLEQMKVVFTPSNVTPAFYIDLINKKIKDYEDYSFELDNIYKKNDIVGYVLVDRNIKVKKNKNQEKLDV